MNKPKVLMIGPGRDVMGGISSLVNNYYACGLNKDVDLYYLTTMKDGSKGKKIVVATKAYFEFAQLLKKYDIVHIHMAAQASFTRKSLFVEKAYKAGKKIIIHQHSGHFNKYFLEQVDDTKRTRIKKVFGLADKVIVLSEEWADFFGKYVCDRTKIEVLYNGVVLPKFMKEDYSDHNVLMLGHLGEKKGTYDLLKAIPSVVAMVPDVIFYLGGDGDIERCQNIVKENGTKDNVVFPGWVRDMDKEKLLKKCSTFILPSYYEGMPMAVLEAMSYGLATISTNAGGIPRIIAQGINGIRVDAGDVNGISSALVEVLTNEEWRRRLGTAGRERIKSEFDFGANVQHLKKIYDSI